MCATRIIAAKDLKEKDIVMLANNVNRLIKYVDVGPKVVYAKSHDGKAMSFPLNEKLVVT